MKPNNTIVTSLFVMVAVSIILVLLIMFRPSATEEVNNSDQGVQIPLEKAVIESQLDSKSATQTDVKTNAAVDTSVDLWSVYPERDQERITSFNELYFNALQFYNREQYDWMVQRGYPTPEDILMADTMSLAELQRMADSGSIVAMNLVVDRTLNEMISLRHEQVAQGLDPYESEVFFKYATLVTKYTDMAAEHGSPFTGYLKARESFELGTINNPSPGAFQEAVELSLLGFAFAASMGDTYAASRARTLAAHASVDIQVFNHYMRYDSFFKSLVGPNCILPPDEMPSVSP